MPNSIDDAHIRAYCRSLVTDLPRGVLGCAISAEILIAIPEAPGRRLPDVTGSAPEIFQALVSWGLLRSMPSARVMAAALAHIAAISPLVAQRSARQWILRLSQLLDDTSVVAEAMCRRVPLALLDLAPYPPASDGTRRGSSIRAERDRLAAEVDLAKEQARDAVQRASVAMERVRAADALATTAQARADAAELRAAAAEQQVAALQRRAAVADEQVMAATRRSEAAEKRAVSAEGRSRMAEDRARSALTELGDVSRAAESAQARLDACWRALGQPAQPLHECIEAERECRAQAEKAVMRLQLSTDELRRDLAAQRTSADAARETSASALKAAQHDAQRAENEMREMRALMGEVRRRERLNEIWSSERETIKSLLHVEKFGDRSLVGVLRTHLDERENAMRDLDRSRQLLAATNDTRPLHELIETMLRRR